MQKYFYRPRLCMRKGWYLWYLQGLFLGSMIEVMSGCPVGRVGGIDVVGGVTWGGAKAAIPWVANGWCGMRWLLFGGIDWGTDWLLVTGGCGGVLEGGGDWESNLDSTLKLILLLLELVVVGVEVVEGVLDVFCCCKDGGVDVVTGIGLVISSVSFRQLSVPLSLLSISSGITKQTN